MKTSITLENGKTISLSDSVFSIIRYKHEFGTSMMDDLANAQDTETILKAAYAMTEGNEGQTVREWAEGISMADLTKVMETVMEILMRTTGGKKAEALAEAGE